MLRAVNKALPRGATRWDGKALTREIKKLSEEISLEQGDIRRYFLTPKGQKRLLVGYIERHLRIRKIPNIAEVVSKPGSKKDFPTVIDGATRTYFGSLSTEKHVIETQFLTNERLATSLILDVDSSRMLRELANELWDGNSDKMMVESMILLLGLLKAIHEIAPKPDFKSGLATISLQDVVRYDPALKGIRSVLH